MNESIVDREASVSSLRRTTKHLFVHIFCPLDNAESDEEGEPQRVS